MCRPDSPRSTATPYLHENSSLLFKTEPPISFVSSALLTFCGLVFNLSLAHTIPLIFNSSSSKIFEYASYNYDDPSDGRRRRVYFDNTWMTFATDYALALELALIIAYICRTSRRSPVRDGTVGLLACYGVSVLVGGLAHQFVRSTEEMNSLAFRVAWIICVGPVAVQAGFIGAIGSAIHSTYPLGDTYFRVPLVPGWAWILYAGVVTAHVAAGGFSMYRPAADIFLTGCTQFVPTVYITAVVMCRKWRPQTAAEDDASGVVGPVARAVYQISSYWLALMLPLYVALTLHGGFTLGEVNLLLHVNLAVAWGCQGLALRRYCVQCPAAALLVKKMI